MKPPTALAAFILTLSGIQASAQDFSSLGTSSESKSSAADVGDNEPVIAATVPTNTDVVIEKRLRGIYRELDGLQPTQVVVQSGVVTLSGSVAEAENIDRAGQIALRVDGVVAVQNELKRDANVSQNLAPVMGRLTERYWQFVQMLPLLVIAFVIIGFFWFIGSRLARANGLWTRISPNNFIADLVATSVRILLTLLGVVIALDLLGATTLLGAILGSAGVIGLAIGFAVKDTVDNYVSSIMLSIRQPFRANDHVVIGNREGRVIRLTSRATILMTLDGNHLRIPNNTVFKAEILNYSRNPERRFDFVLGVDAADDPGAAMKVGIDRLRELPFILQEPSAGGRLEEVGDSSIILRFVGWIDQTQTDWFKARSTTIRAVKIAIEEHGFGLPEPIYRLRFDSGNPLEIARVDTAAPTSKAKANGQRPVSTEPDDVSVQNDIETKVNEERKDRNSEDMLDERRPVE